MGPVMMLCIALAAIVSGDDSYELIARMKDTRQGLFDKNSFNEGNQNANDPEANAYSIIGQIGDNLDKYRDAEGYYQFKLIYGNADGSSNTLEWKQTSWIETTSITGFVEIYGITGQQDKCYVNHGGCCCFVGLGLTSAAGALGSSYIDGNANGGCWCSGVVTFDAFTGGGSGWAAGTGIPAFNYKVAYSEELYIYQADDNTDGLLTVVIENFGGYIQAGFAGEAVPRIIDFPSIVGRPRFNGMGTPTLYFGEDAWNKRGILDLSYPLSGDVVNNWNDMEALWNHIFYEQLNINPENHCFLITDPPFSNDDVDDIRKPNREKMTKIMFETFNVPCFYVMIDAVAALKASQRITGIVVEIHEDITHILPIYQGYPIPNGYTKLDIGVKHLVDYMSTMLSFTTTAEKELARDILQRFGYAALDYEYELQRAAATTEIERTYKLPDGNIITIEYERFEAIEVLFRPSIIGLERDGVHQLIFESIMKCSEDIRPALYRNVVLSGIGTIYSGIDNRIREELNSLSPPSIVPKVISRTERKFLTWIGGSIISSASTFQSMWINKFEYEDAGPTIVHQKCFAHKGEQVNLIQNAPLFGMEMMVDDNEYYLRINKFGCLGLIFLVLFIFIISIWNILRCYTMLNLKATHVQYDEVRIISDTD